MPRDYLQYLDDILDAVKRIVDFTADLSFKDFERDIKTQDAVLRNLQVIGEAVKVIPEEVKKSNPDIEWRKIAGLRDIITHLYFGIDNTIIWDILTNKLGPLEKGIRQILHNYDEPV